MQKRCTIHQLRQPAKAQPQLDCISLFERKPMADRRECRKYKTNLHRRPTPTKSCNSTNQNCLAGLQNRKGEPRCWATDAFDKCFSPVRNSQRRRLSRSMIVVSQMENASVFGECPTPSMRLAEASRSGKRERFDRELLLCCFCGRRRFSPGSVRAIVMPVAMLQRPDSSLADFVERVFKTLRSPWGICAWLRTGAGPLQHGQGAALCRE